jgi:hypothetical protein
MKFKSLSLLISGIVLSFTACQKDNVPGSASVDGKWQETKLRIYGDSAGILKYDTTYTKPFTAADYIRFNSNGTCAIASDHYYYPNTDNYPKTPPLIPISVGTWKYSFIGNATYVLNQQSEYLNPGGFNINDTVRVLSAHSLWLHVVFYSHMPGYFQVTDSYYQK